MRERDWESEYTRHARSCGMQDEVKGTGYVVELGFRVNPHPE